MGRHPDRRATGRASPSAIRRRLSHRIGADYRTPRPPHRRAAANLVRVFLAEPTVFGHIATAFAGHRQRIGAAVR
ncbi:hypothetical protein BV133_727 [Blastochloris viridis]|uniref:Uncharacterized protein n=1 Tax=Blastochloris viridis TaxID=1079 RepID=A0A182CYN2_BLAVI|nr:hypothetical protein BV133_727 [Blastochloris viridis]